MYDLYGKMAQEITDNTLAVGRTTFQKFSEPLMIQDVRDKLALTLQDTVLEIGCGTGTLLFPLSQLVNKIYGIDHPAVITRIMNSPYPDNCYLMAGNWLEDEFRLPEMTKIIIYNVIQLVGSFEQVLAFIEKALTYLPVGGQMLVGDIPNTDRKKRFAASDYGKQFNNWWSQQKAKFKTEEEIWREQLLAKEITLDTTMNHGFDANNKLLYCEFTDEMILNTVLHLRKTGHECYLLPQPAHLPFGHTREDLLIVKGT